MCFNFTKMLKKSFLIIFTLSYFPVYFALFIFVQSGFEVSNCTPPQAVVRGYSGLCFAASHARSINLRAYASIGMPLSSQLRFERRYAGIRAGLSRG